VLNARIALVLSLIANSAIARPGVWNPEQLMKEADLVVQVELVNSDPLTDRKGTACGASYEAKVSKIEKGAMHNALVRFSMGPDFALGERFRVYLRYVKAEGDYFHRRVPPRQPSVQLELSPSHSTMMVLKCAGVIPGWVPLGIERLP
jgi:hypothetical protein